MSNKAMTWAIDCNVARSHKLVLMLLADAHNGHTGACFPSQAWIMEKGGLGESTVQNCLMDLEKWELLKRETTRLGRGKGSRTDYVLNLEKLDPSNIDLYNSGLTPLKTEDLHPSNIGVSYKEEPESNRNITGSSREVFDFYNQTAKRVGWVVHSKLTDALKHPLNARIEEHGAEQVMQFIEALSKLDWTVNGFNGNGFRASLTYITRPRTFAEQFDKLVTSGPLPLFDGGERPKPASSLEHAFSVLSEHGEWLGHRYGHPTDPRDPNANYPEELYTQFKIARAGSAA